MRTVRVCLPEATHSDMHRPLPLPAQAFQHLVRVLRLPEGADIQVFNGRGERFQATLVEIGKKRGAYQLEAALTPTAESPLHTHLGLVMSKGDRFDYALQKATELGVTSITPLTSEHCDLKLNPERREKKLAHWQGVIESACEQCYRDTAPVLYPIRPLQEWVDLQDSDVQLVLHTAARAPDWPDLPPQSVSFLVGPEGGLSEAEVTFAHSNDFLSWQLGPRILRTETAPVVMLSLLQQRWGDF